MPSKQTIEPCLVVIFGASGDLTKRKLLPALFELFVDGYLPPQFAVLGVSRTPMSDDAFRGRMKEFCAKGAHFDEGRWSTFARQVFYHAGDAADFGQFGPIRDRISQLGAQAATRDNVLFYLSLAPQLYEPVITNIGAAGVVAEGKRWCSIVRDALPWQRLVVEKPFGHDLESAAHLNRVIGRVFEEEATFRIDHYLGKETIQNLMVFRFANAIFEPLWNRQYVDHVQITAAESLGVEGRGGYYEHSGALRDMIQSHLLQVMAAVAMEAPNSFRAADLRTEQRKVLEAVRQIKAEDVTTSAIRGQYGTGSINGKALPAYTAEEGVDPHSNTETYAAMRLLIDNWRWKDVPFYLRTGKGMKRKLTQIVLYFRPTPHSLFLTAGGDLRDPTPNRLVINVQPDEGISLRFEGKVPGQELQVRSAVLDFDYAAQFGGRIPEAYSHLLLDAMMGDRSLFKDRHEIEAAWRIVMPVLEQWQTSPRRDMYEYPAGSWGPDAAESLFKGRGHWHNPEGEQTRWRKDPA